MCWLSAQEGQGGPVPELMLLQAGAAAILACSVFQPTSLLQHTKPQSTLLSCSVRKKSSASSKHFFSSPGFHPVFRGEEDCLVNQALVRRMLENFEEAAQSVSEQQINFQDNCSCSFCFVYIDKGLAKCVA